MKALPFLVVFYFVSLLAEACTCVFPSFEEQMKIATRVFTGKVIDVTQQEDGISKINLKTTKTWKGNPKETISVYTSSDTAACGYPFEPDEEYLVYATGDQRLNVSLCSRTKRLTDASEDLQYLKSNTSHKAGRRDPFSEMRGDRVKEYKAVPKALNITHAVIVGITKKNDAFVALIRATNNKVYFLKVGDKLHDGVVVKIDSNSVTFRRNNGSALVRKQLRPFPDD